MSGLKGWAFQVLIAIDQLLNVVVCNGYADETMSAHCYRMELEGKPWGFMRPVIDRIMFFQPNHCREAYESEVLRLQSPISERTLNG